MRTIPLYLAAAIPFWVLDAVWLGFVARRLYAREMGALLARPVRWPAAIAFYLVYPAGIAVFAVAPVLAFSSNGWLMGAALGGLFGFFCYATYNLTALAVIQGFPRRLALVDLAWGTILTAATAALATQLMRLIG